MRKAGRPGRKRKHAQVSARGARRGQRAAPPVGSPPHGRAALALGLRLPACRGPVPPPCAEESPRAAQRPEGSVSPPLPAAPASSSCPGSARGPARLRSRPRGALVPVLPPRQLPVPRSSGMAPGARCSSCNNKGSVAVRSPAPCWLPRLPRCGRCPLPPPHMSQPRCSRAGLSPYPCWCRPCAPAPWERPRSAARAGEGSGQRRGVVPQGWRGPGSSRTLWGTGFGPPDAAGAVEVVALSPRAVAQGHVGTCGAGAHGWGARGGRPGAGVGRDWESCATHRVPATLVQCLGWGQALPGGPQPHREGTRTPGCGAGGEGLWGAAAERAHGCGGERWHRPCPGAPAGLGAQPACAAPRPCPRTPTGAGGGDTEPLSGRPWLEPSSLMGSTWRHAGTGGVGC